MGAAQSSPENDMTCGIGPLVSQLTSRGRMQSAFVFAKPHANTPAVQQLIKKKFGEVGVKIQSEGEITGEAINSEGYIDQHYYAIASKATILKPSALNIPTDKFSAAFGEEWSKVLKEGRAYNAMDVQGALGLSPEALDKAWLAAKSAGKLIKFGGGFYCALIDASKKVYTFNAFFMSMRGKFTQPGSSIHWYVVEFDSAKLSWADFRGKVLGPTEPSAAPADSLRGMIFSDWQALGLTSVPNTGDNGVHASASPFEGLAERMNWLKTPLEADRFGALLLSKGISAEALKAWSVDPQVLLPGENGKKGSLFDQLEDMDLAECVAKCVELFEANKTTFDRLWPQYEKKMRKEGLSQAAISAFKYNFSVLTSGANLMIPESTIKPVDSLPDYASLSKEDASLLKQTVMVKLNGGLGTGMGLEKAKSLLDLKDGMTFLDFIASQVTEMRERFGVPLAFMLMNSFATSADTLKYLSKYKDLKSAGLPLEFVQNKAPKLTESDLTPADWPSKPDCEWCPPGHGDLYPAMLGTKSLDALLAKGFKYMFVSNSDNLGATMDLKLLTWFAESGKPFAMECAQRTDADKKGGHLAADSTTGGLLLRESAQCPDEDEKEFQNVNKYKYFNTNNLWVNLEALKQTMDENDGVLPLPVIKNGKTVDPRDKKSTKVLQLETAMGAAIASFKGAGAILIPRTRFAPVKTTNDMLALMSDAYEVTKDFRMVLKAERNGMPPDVKLDGAYKFVDALQALVPNGPPSLIGCKKITIEGKVVFASGVVIQGDVKIVNTSDTVKTVAAGTYANTTVNL